MYILTDILQGKQWTSFPICCNWKCPLISTDRTFARYRLLYQGEFHFGSNLIINCLSERYLSKSLRFIWDSHCQQFPSFWLSHRFPWSRLSKYRKWVIKKRRKSSWRERILAKFQTKCAVYTRWFASLILRTRLFFFPRMNGPNVSFNFHC